MKFDSLALAQLGLLVFGCSSVWVLGRPEHWRRFGYVLGLVSQPCWFYVSFRSREWAIFILSFVYTYTWAQGVWFHLIKPELVQPEVPTEVPNRVSLPKRLGQPSGAFKL